MPDTETEATNAEGYAGWDIDDTLIVIGVSILGVVALAFWLDPRLLAQQGVTLIGSGLSPINAGFQGLAQLISSFFTWASKGISNLMIHPAASAALAKVYVSSHIAARLQIGVTTSSGYAAALPMGV